VLNVLWVVLGVCSLLVALVLCLVLLRLHRTLAVLEETLMTADQAMRELVPEVRGSLGNVNDMTAAVNVVLRSAGMGAARLTDGVGERASHSARDASATLHGIRVAASSLWHSYAGPGVDHQERGGRRDVR
jgi:uncharacterized protein YoxC